MIKAAKRINTVWGVDWKLFTRRPTAGILIGSEGLDAACFAYEFLYFLKGYVNESQR